MRPELADFICAFLELEQEDGVSRLQQAYGSCKDYIERNCHAVQGKTEYDNECDKLAVEHFFTALLSDAQKRDMDAERELELAALARETKLSRPSKMKENLKMLDVIQCAPQCMKKLLEQAVFGDTQQQAALTQQQRGIINVFLLEQKQIPAEIKEMVQPKRMIAYELEEHAQQTWEQIQAGVDESWREVAEREETNKGVVTCSQLMKLGLCPCARPLPASFANAGLTAQKSKQTEIFVEAKKLCHANLQALFKTSKAAGRTLPSVSSAGMDWTMSPHDFTQTALRGTKGNSNSKTSEQRAAKKQRTQK
jgi:hypothetical protein